MYRTNALSGTSLVLGRWGAVATTPPGEQQLLERLRAAASEAGCRAPDVVTTVYTGLKLGLRVCVYGAAPHGAASLVEALAAAIVGIDSQQILRLHGPLAERPAASGRPGDVSRRYAAIRLNEFVATAVDPLSQGKAWFVVADTHAAPDELARWLEHELRTALRSSGARAAPNLFVLLAAGEAPSRLERRWLGVPLRRYKQPAAPRPAPVLPVGFQRQLLQSRLTGQAYRALLRSSPPKPRRFQRRGVLQRRWLAASVDASGRGLWRSSPAANVRRALLALERSFNPGHRVDKRAVEH